MIQKETAFEALKIQIDEDDFFWDSYEAIDKVMREFITGDDNDNDWVSVIINFVGHDYYIFKIWFEEQSTKPDEWSKKQFELINEWFENLNNL
jgi:hypothetical protein